MDAGQRHQHEGGDVGGEGDGIVGTAEAAEHGAALLDTFRSLGRAFSDDLLLHRLGSVGDDDALDAAAAAAAAAPGPPHDRHGQAGAGERAPSRRRPWGRRRGAPPAATDDAAAAASAAAAAARPAPSPSPVPPPPKPPPLPPPPLYAPYRPTLLDHVRRHVLGPEVQLAAQIAAGLALTAIFVFVDGARYPGGCVAMTLFLVVAVQSSPSADVGCRFGAAASFLGAMWVAGLLAGAVGSLARALAIAGGGGGVPVPTNPSLPSPLPRGPLQPPPHGPSAAHAPEPGLTIALSLLSIPWLLAFAAVRMAPSPPALQGAGLTLTIFYGMDLVAARSAASHGAIWHSVLTQLISSLVGVGAALLVTALVLPTLASEAVEDAVSRALRVAGQSLSRTSARVFSPPEASAEAVSAALERKRSRDASKRGGGALARGEEADDGGDDDDDSDRGEDDDEDDAAAADALDRTRVAADAWAPTTKATRPPPPPPLGVLGGALPLAPASTARSSGRLPSFVEAARRLPPRPVPGTGGAIVMEREPDELPAFKAWWDLVSAPVEEPPSARRQRRRRETALRDRDEHRRRVAAQALSRGMRHRRLPPQQQQQQQQQGTATSTAPSSAHPSPFAAAAAAASVTAADDVERQQRQQQAQQAAEEEEDDEAWARRAYEEATSIMRADGSFAGSSLGPRFLDLGAAGPPIAGLRPLLGAARMALGAAALEPDCLRGRADRRFDPPRWAALIGAIERLVTRASALEAVAEDGGGLNEERAVWLAPMLAAKRRAFAEVAACLALLSEAARDRRPRRGGGKAAACASTPGGGGGGGGGGVCSAEELFGRSWQACREELKAGLTGQVEAYVRSVRAAVAAPPSSASAPPLVLFSGYNARLHFFSFAVTAAVIDAMQRVEDAARHALCPVLLAEERRAARNAAAAAAAAASGRRPLSTRLPAVPPWLSALAGLAVMRPAALHLAALAPRVYAYLASCRRRSPAPPPPSSSSDSALAAPSVSSSSLSRASSTKRGPSSSSSSSSSCLCPSPPPPLPREAVAALKYALAGWLALTGTLVALASSGAARRLYPVYGFVACAIAATDRVEATASRVVSWLLGSTVGGALGLAVMAAPRMAADGPVLVLLVAVVAFAVSLLGLTAFRTAIVLSLLTYSALVVCQYNDGCRLFTPPPPDPAMSPAANLAAATCVPHGTVEVFVARICAVAAGVLLAQAVTSLLAPWYTSDWARATMARALRDGAAPFLAREYDRFFDEGKAAAEATAAAAAKAGASPAAASPDPPPPPPPPPVPAAEGDAVTSAAVRALQTSVAAPLVAVQLSLARDAVQWRRGVLAVPPVVPLVLRSMLSLLDRLAALEVTLQVGAPVAGRFTGVAFATYFRPMEAAWRGVVAASCDLAGATAAHLVATGADRRLFAREEEEHAQAVAENAAGEDDGGGGGGGRPAHPHPHPHHHHRNARRERYCAAREASHAEVLRALAALRAARARAREAQVAARVNHLQAILAAPTDREALDTFVAPDDTLRLLAFVMAWIKAVNRLESVARAALRDDGASCSKARRSAASPSPPPSSSVAVVAKGARGSGGGSGGGGGGRPP